MPRRVRRAVGRVAAALTGVEPGSRKMPHAIAWRLREHANRVPSRIAVHDVGASGGRPILLLVSHDLSRSGAPQVLAEIATLCRKRYAVTVLTPVDGAWREPLVAAGVTVIVDPDLQRGDTTLLRALAPVAAVALCNTVDTAVAVTVLAASVPTIWYLHEAGLIGERLRADSAIAAALHAATAVWTVSEAGQCALAPVRADTAVVPYGCRPLSGTQAEPGTGYVLTLGVFGSIEARKGQDLLVSALKLLPPDLAARIRIRCHGRTLEPAFHADLLHAAAALPNFAVEPPLGPGDYAAAVAACDAIVAPSRDDPLPIAITDGLGAGRVVLCSKRCGQAAFIRDGVDGYVAETPEADELAALLVRAINDRARWATIGRNGRALFDRLFSIDVFEQRVDGELTRLQRKEPHVANAAMLRP
jgi:glycosyltransferase involved in cell wall biosynthesis